MRVVYLVPAESKAKAEDLLKKDDVVSRASIFIRSCPSLDSSEDGFFFILSGSTEQLAAAAGLLKGIAKKYEKPDAVLAVFDRQDSAAVEGFGNILG